MGERTVVVMGGTYSTSAGNVSSDAGATEIYVPPGVELFGGYFDDYTAHDPTNYPTILQGIIVDMRPADDDTTPVTSRLEDVSITVQNADAITVGTDEDMSYEIRRVKVEATGGITVDALHASQVDDLVVADVDFSCSGIGIFVALVATTLVENATVDAGCGG